MGKKKESKLVKYLLIGISILFLFVMLVLPLIVVVTEALKKGWQVYVEAVTDSFTIAAPVSYTHLDVYKRQSEYSHWV